METLTIINLQTFKMKTRLKTILLGCKQVIRIAANNKNYLHSNFQNSETSESITITP